MAAVDDEPAVDSWEDAGDVVEAELEDRIGVGGDVGDAQREPERSGPARRRRDGGVVVPHAVDAGHDPPGAQRVAL